MYIKKLKGGGEIRARCLGASWTLSVITEKAKGVTVGLDLIEGGELARLLTFENRAGFEEEDTGVIDARSIDGEQQEKENTGD